ncbi:uncharacterized protein LOC114351900 [Ostrinia furnacalis]|uniref:uncharacterized protein LOC114351900 n=1 Tax=Ostrinia furnacalis TaxID=93504 RepID=UPI00103DF564|nr:uncharacterized protein LOC114351900 [Ostrinia furnacalis]
MAPLFFILALIVQSSFIYATDDIDKEEWEDTSREILKSAPGDMKIKEFRATDTDWIDIFSLPKQNLHQTSSAAKMASVTNSDKPPAEQLEDIKEMANQITLAIQSEMANLLSYALRDCEKEYDENSLRKKRSLESPMDSSQLVMRLLKHIKNNNEYQNIAIEKMMSAQEIADKFGIEFNPDPEILSDLAVATNKQAEELTTILKDAYDSKNETKEIEFIPVNNETSVKSTENNTYFVYSVPEAEIIAHQNSLPSYEYVPEFIQERPPVHVHYEQHPHYNYHSHPYETQIVSPPHQMHQQRPPVSHMPNFYEQFTPAPEYYSPYYPMEPVTTTTTIVFPIEELVEPEPELVGEEFEETVSSKVIVERGDEPGSATVNHVMTYTVGEKSHFKKPQIENLPQQMQYYFFLM